MDRSRLRSGRGSRLLCRLRTGRCGLRGGGPNQFRQRKIYGIDGAIFFLTETGDLHQSQFDEQPLVGRLPDFAVEVREQRYGAEKKFGRAGGRLRPVSFHQRTGKFQQPERRLVAGHQQVAQVAIESRHESLAGESPREHVVEREQRLDIVARQERFGHAEVGVVVQYVERLGHLLIAEFLPAERNGLVEHRQGVAHAAVGFLCDQVERLVVGGDSLLRGDVFEVFHGVLDADAVEVVDLAAGEDRRDNLVFFGGRQDEDGVCGRLLERLEEGVEGGRREHVDLVDDEDRVASHLRDDAHLFDERTDVLDRVVRRGVQLVDVERASVVETAARFARVAGFGPFGMQAVDRLGEDAGAGGLAHAARSAEEISVGKLTALDRVLQGRSDVLLPHDR